MRAEVGAAFLLCLWFLATSVAAAGSGSTKPSHFSVPFNRTLFPPGFLFGAGTSAYQSEGAVNIDGRGPSIWDTFTKQHPEKISDGSNGDVAIDFYHRYKSDIRLFKEIGLDTFRFSIAWSRIFPKGKGQVNDLGVKYYNSLINELLANGIQPFVTLYHWDLPQALEDEYKGFLGSQFVDDFRNYADFCFKTFGDRVKYWVTFNEPYMFINNAYSAGSFAPGRCSSYAGTCPYGDSATEPYLAGHHLLLGHAAAVKVYKSAYQAHQKGQIGITLVTNWYEPKSKSLADVEAANRALDFWFGWFGDPVAFGDYPKSMKTNVGNRLPTFTKEQSADLKGSYDFLGVNYYTSNYVENNSTVIANKTVAIDMQVTNSFKSNLGVTIGTPTDLVWLYIYPQGLHRLLVYVKEKYKNPPVYINENGVGEKNNATKPVEEAIKDAVRIRYHDGHLRAVLKAIKDGVNVKGYYIWTIFDDFEWSAGFTSRFGLLYVDYKNNLGRHLKYSAYWLKMFLLK